MRDSLFYPRVKRAKSGDLFSATDAPLILRVSLVIVLLLVLGGAAAWFFGPREPVDLTVTFDPASIGDDPDAYLVRAEADVPNLRPADAKEIVWAYPASRAKTPLAIVYIHGFSGSKEDIRPVPDEVAKRLGANLFLMRLSGHGRNGAAMAEPAVNDWVNDLAEAMAIGRMIGERVVVLSASTGGTLVTLGTNVPGLFDDVRGLAFVSPNYAVTERFAFVLDLPWVRAFGPTLFGEERGFEPVNEAHATHWTTRYPITALLPMAALVRAVRGLNVESVAIPALFIVSPQDQVVDPNATKAIAARWGGPKEVIEVARTDDPSNHVLAGRILSPSTTEEVTGRIADWIEALPAR